MGGLLAKTKVEYKTQYSLIPQGLLDNLATTTEETASFQTAKIEFFFRM
jgi:hypothetical protein